MPDYSCAKIYKIVSTDEDKSNLIYIGSTTQKLDRKYIDHIKYYNYWKNGKYQYLPIFRIFGDTSYDSKIELIKMCPCKTKKELENAEKEEKDKIQSPMMLVDNLTTESCEYINSVIYKIFIKNELSPLIYIGSSKNGIQERLWGHKSDYNKWKSGEKHWISIFKLFEEFGIDNCDIEVLREVQANSKKELELAEAEEIEKIPNENLVNKICPRYENIEDHKKQYHKEYHQQHREEHLATMKAYRETDENKQKKKEYREMNKDKINEQKRAAYQKNREKILSQQKEYAAGKKEELKAYNKEYREKNNEAINKARKEKYEANKDKLNEIRRAKNAAKKEQK